MADDARIELTGFDNKGAPFTVETPPGCDVPAAEAKIRQTGGRVLAARRIEPERVAGGAPSAEDFVRFNEMLATALSRGVPMLDGLRDLSGRMPSPRLRNAVGRVSGRLQRGEPLREAFAREQAVFPPLYGALLEAGAVSGNLSEVLLALSRNVRNETGFRRGLAELCAYPLYLLVLGTILLTGFTTVLMPTYGTLAAQVTTPGFFRDGVLRVLPAFTPALALVALVAAWLAGVRKTVFGRRLSAAVLRHAPLTRAVYDAMIWSCAIDTLALLVRARVPAPAALRLVADAADSPALAVSLKRLAEGVEHGRRLSAVAAPERAVPRCLVRAFEQAEVHGDLDRALTQASQRYRRDAEMRTQTLLRYMPIALALIFGLMVLALGLLLFGPYIDLWWVPWS